MENKLIVEYRTTMPTEVLHLWAQDVIKALEAADEMAEALDTIEHIRRSTYRSSTPINTMCTDAAKAYRTATQKENGDD